MPTLNLDFTLLYAYIMVHVNVWHTTFYVAYNMTTALVCGSHAVHTN